MDKVYEFTVVEALEEFIWGALGGMDLQVVPSHVGHFVLVALWLEAQNVRFEDT